MSFFCSLRFLCVCITGALAVAEQGEISNPDHVGRYFPFWYFARLVPDILHTRSVYITKYIIIFLPQNEQLIN